MLAFTTGQSLSPVRSVSHVFQGGIRQLSSCRVAVAKLAGAPTGLSRIDSPALGLLHSFMTKEDREPPPGIGKCLRTTTWRMTLSPESIFLHRDPTWMQD